MPNLRTAFVAITAALATPAPTADADPLLDALAATRAGWAGAYGEFADSLDALHQRRKQAESRSGEIIWADLVPAVADEHLLSLVTSVEDHAEAMRSRVHPAYREYACNLAHSAVPLRRAWIARNPDALITGARMLAAEAKGELPFRTQPVCEGASWHADTLP